MKDRPRPFLGACHYQATDPRMSQLKKKKKKKSKEEEKKILGSLEQAWLISPHQSK
jgi:hypothetical protein